jgi:hypothetical protein
LLVLLVLMLMMFLMLLRMLLLRSIGRVEKGVIDFVPKFAREGEIVHYFLFLLLRLF